MKHIWSTSSAGYSVIAAVLMIGFLLVLTTSTLNLVLQEMQDSRGKQDYIKAYAAAEWALELALLKVKENGYGYDYDGFRSESILWEGVKIPEISYTYESRVDSHSGSIAAYGSDIIPLFSIDESWVLNNSTQIELSADEDIVWNIITQESWVSGVWSFDENTNIWEKSFNETTGELRFDTNRKIWDILSSQDYLILQNLSANTRTYTFSADGWGFTLPRAIISSKAKVWKYTQNLETTLDNTEFLGILQYSIYSWN